MLEKNQKYTLQTIEGLLDQQYGTIFSERLHQSYRSYHKELDLTDQVAVKNFFDEEQPDAVVLAVVLLVV